MFDSLGQVLGFAGGIIMIAAGLPQVFRIRKLGNTDGFALSPWILMLVTFSAYTAYGIASNSPAIWVTNIASFITSGMVVTAVKGNNFKNWLLIGVTGLVCGGLIIVVPHIVSSTILMLLTGNRIPQLIRTWLNRHTAMVTAVSVSSLAIAFTSMICWLLYAIFTGDKFIVATTVVSMVITALTAAVELHIARLARAAHVG